MEPNEESKEGGVSEFVQGSIVRIKLHDFMTYKHCEFRPGPRLNLVIGPNGSGKSSVVCAVCLGLGGDPKDLGRSSKVGRFVRNGQEKAVIEIELYNDNGKNNLTVKRVITVTDGDGQSNWYINEVEKTQKAVRKQLKNMHVEVSNLTMVLPQDRVGDFSKLDQYQLLRETAKSVHGDFMIERQENLIEGNKELQKKKRHYLKQQATLESDIARNANLERQVAKLKDREANVKRLDILEKLKPWLEFEQARKQALVLRESKDNKKAELKKVMSELDPLRQKTKAAKDHQKEVENERKVKKKQYESAKRKVLKASDKLDDTNEAIEELYSKLKELNDQERFSKQKILKEKTNIDKIEQSIAELEDKETIESRLKSAQATLKPLTKQKSKKVSEKKMLKIESDSHQRDISMLEKKLKKFEGAHQKKLKKLDKLVGARHAVKIFNYVHSQQIKNAFTGKVHGPLVLEINIKDDVDALCIENILPRSSFVTYITENEEDRNILMKMQGCNVMNVDPQTIKEPRRLFDLNELKQYGIKGFADQVLTGHPVVLEALRRSNNLHTILIGSKSADAAVEKQNLLRKLSEMNKQNGGKGSAMLVTPATIYKTSISRYSGDTVTSTSQINPNRGKGQGSERLLRGGTNDGDEEEKRELLQERKELQSKYEDLQNQIEQVSQEYAIIDKQTKEADKVVSEANKIKNIRNTMLSRLKSHKAKLAGYERDANKDYEGEAEKIRDEISAENDKTVLNVKVLVQRVEEKVSHYNEFASKNMRLSLAHAQVKAFQEQLKQEGQKHEDLQEELAKIADELKQLTSRAKKIKSKAEKEAPMETYKPLFEKESFDDPDLLENEIRMIKQELQDQRHNPQLIAEYNERKEKIEELKPLVEQMKVELDNSTQELNVIKQSFEIPMQTCVNSINKSFQEKFAAICARGGYKCAGEVVFIKPEEDLSLYGIAIKVKFREGQKMQQLSAEVQSGGERSLSTFLYLLALQDLAKSPFRVVDEINQGMDASKERLAFDRLIDSSCTKKSPQYFLITPKLLKGLPYTKDVTINFVYNGPHCVPQSLWNNFFDSFREKRKNVAEVAVAKRQKITA